MKLKNQRIKPFSDNSSGNKELEAFIKYIKIQTYSCFTTGIAIWLCIRRNSGFFGVVTAPSLFSSCSNLLVPSTLSLNGGSSSSLVFFSKSAEFSRDIEPPSEMSEVLEFCWNQKQII